MLFSVESSSEDKAGQPTKLSQFLKAPSPSQERNDQDLSTGSHKRDTSDHSERDTHRDRQAARSDREHERTQQRLLALAEYSDQRSSDRDTRDSNRHRHHKSTHQSKVKSSRSPGHRRH